MSMTDQIRQFALSQGAQLVGVAGVEACGEYLEEVGRRLQETGADSADYMISPVSGMPGSGGRSFFECLADARRTLAGAKSIIILGVYAYDEAAVYGNTHRELRGKTARIYSYYPVVRQISESVVGFLEERGYRAVQGQHVPLKFVADKIGLGAYGKNGVFQTQQYGSYVALRDVLTDAELEPDWVERVSTQCDECGRCLKACPTGALYAPYKVNPRLCINPITRREAFIEPEIRAKMQNWIHGCDICQEVCPANKGLEIRSIDPRAGFDSEHHASHRHLDGLERMPELIKLLSAEQPEIIRRNAAIALGNTGKGRIEALTALREHLGGMSPGLKEYFMWAIGKIDQEDLRAR